MPRAKATAALTAARRIHQFDEPFRVDDEFLPRLSEFNARWLIDKDRVIYEWQPFLKRLALPETAVKIHGRELRLPIAKFWYNRVLTTQSHHIFVIERKNRLEIALSYMVASVHGCFENEFPSSIKTAVIHVTDDDIFNFKRHVTQYLDNFPTYGTVITFESLPTEFFDISKIRVANQKSAERYFKIDNLEYCIDQIKKLLDSVNSEWDAKLRALTTIDRPFV